MRRSAFLLTLAGTLLLTAPRLRASEADRLLATAALSAGQSALQTGWYRFDAADGSRVSLSDSDFSGRYLFESLSSGWRPFVLGGVGWSRIEKDPGSSGSLEIDSLYGTVGGGISADLTPTLKAEIGARGLWMRSDLSGSDPLRPEDANTFLGDLYAEGTLHTRTEGGYLPYAKAGLHRLYLEIEDRSSGHGYAGDLTLGVYTPALGTWQNRPIRGHLYATLGRFGDGLEDLSYLKSHESIGGSLLYPVGQWIPWKLFEKIQLGLNLQATRGDRGLEGFKASLSFTRIPF